VRGEVNHGRGLAMTIISMVQVVVEILIEVIKMPGQDQDRFGQWLGGNVGGVGSSRGGQQFPNTACSNSNPRIHPFCWFKFCTRRKKSTMLRLFLDEG
jgi:hypothetical protein